MGAVAVVLACSNTPPPDPPPTPPSPEADDEPELPTGPEAIETGKDCATAEADCEAGMCTTQVKNACDTAVTCEMVVLALCEGSTTEGEAKGKARGTIPPGQTDKLQAVADCEGQAITATTVDALSCK